MLLHIPANVLLASLLRHFRTLEGSKSYHGDSEKKKENRKTVFIPKRMNTAYRYTESLVRNQIVKLFFFNDKEVVLVV